MNIPETLKVGGHIFKVIRNYKFKERTDVDGQSDLDLLEIRLKDKDLSGNELHQERKEQIFLHEVLHCIDDIYNGNELEEKEVKRMSNGLYQVLKDNEMLK